MIISLSQVGTGAIVFWDFGVINDKRHSPSTTLYVEFRYTTVGITTLENLVVFL